jgi:hypothetical protein
MNTIKSSSFAYALRLPVHAFLITMLFLESGLTSNSSAQEKPQNEPKLYRLDPPPAPKTGVRADFLAEIAYYEQRYMELAKVIPAEKYAWRPTDGTRTFGEILAHVTVMNTFSQRSLEEPLKPGVTYGFSNERVEKGTMALANDKEKLLPQLKLSFSSLRQQVLLMNDADAEAHKLVFGRHTTMRGGFFLITQNLGEHLGQLIAYARMNGVTPPWSQEAAHKQ